MRQEFKHGDDLLCESPHSRADKFNEAGMASALLSIAQYNPMQANTIDRINHIAYHMQGFDIAILIGTKVPHAKYLKDDFSTRKTDCGSLVLDAGYGSGCFTNKHAGISFILNNRHLRCDNLVDKGTLKGEAKGRAAFLRFKAIGSDFALIGAYYPPKPNTKSAVSVYTKTCEKITDWLRETIGNLPATCTPIIAVDLNDGIGKTKNGREIKYNHTTVIEAHASRLEKISDGAGSSFRRLCEVLDLTAHTANADHRNTWYSGDGQASSLIDYIVAPRLLQPRRAGQLTKLGQILQHVEVNRKLDHMPIFITIYVGENKDRFCNLPPQKWNYDKLMECINSGKHRAEFIKETEECCKNFLERHPMLLEQHTPDDFAENLMQELVTIAQKHFHKNNKTRNPSYERAKQVRNALLEERGRLRIEMHKILNQESEHQQPPQIKLSDIQADLKQLTQLLKKIRQHQWNETCEQLTQELHEAWQRRDVKTSFDLMRRLAGSKFDTKNGTGD